MTGASSAVTEHKEFCAWMFDEFLVEKLESGEFLPIPQIEVVEGGLEMGVVADWSGIGRVLVGRRLLCHSWCERGFDC